MTEEGRELLVAAQQLVDCAEALRQMTANRRGKPMGRVRLAVSVPLGLHLSDKIGRLLTRYEELSVDLVLRDEVSDLNEEGLDLEVRIGPIEDAVLIARCIGWTTAHLVAAPSYLEGRCPPAHPRDLKRHDCIVYHRWGRDDVWWFSASAGDPGAEIAVNVRGWFRANNAAAVQRAALAGHGIAMLSHLLVSEDIEKGRLRRLLPEYPSRRFPLYIAYPSRRGLPPRTRAVIEYLAELLGEDPAMTPADPVLSAR